MVIRGTRFEYCGSLGEIAQLVLIRLENFPGYELRGLINSNSVDRRIIKIKVIFGDIEGGSPHVEGERSSRECWNKS